MAAEPESVEEKDEQPESPAPEKPLKARSKNPKLTSFAVWCIARFIGITLRYKHNDLPKIKAAVKEHNGAIVVSWHGRSLIGTNLFNKLGFWALISLSRDGEIQDGIFKRFGFQTVRGSTGRGGARATLQLTKKIQNGGVLAFTPDGPRGPTQKVQQGTIFFAQRTGRPIMVMGTSAVPRKLLPTWDSYMIPYPFAKAAFVVGDPIFVAADLDEAGKQAAAEEVEAALNAVQARAEEITGAALRG
ncbi:MAG: lysophospholipid acyltransferase family protein [Chthonomonadales bacterium]